MQAKSVRKVRKKKITFSPFNKVQILLVTTILLVFLVEIFFRISNIKFGNPASQDAFATYTIDNFHPFLQHQNVKGDNKRQPDLHINSFGFRGEEVQKKKPEGVYRIFVLGGSTVLNKYVSYEENATKILENKLNAYFKDKKIEVLNAGADGYTSEHSLIQYVFKIKDYAPDLIIMWHGINDMDYSCSPINFSHGAYTPDYSHMYGALANVINDYYGPKSLFNFVTFEYLNHFLSTSFYSDITNKFRNTSANPITNKDRAVSFAFPSINAYARNLKTLISFTNIDGVKLMLGNQPFLFSKKINKDIKSYDVAQLCLRDGKYPDLESVIRGINSFNSTTKTIAEENNIPFVDLESKIPKTEEYFLDDVHFRQNGNKIVADALFQSIVENNLIN